MLLRSTENSFFERIWKLPKIYGDFAGEQVCYQTFGIPNRITSGKRISKSCANSLWNPRNVHFSDMFFDFNAGVHFWWRLYETGRRRIWSIREIAFSSNTRTISVCYRIKYTLESCCLINELWVKTHRIARRLRLVIRFFRIFLSTGLEQNLLLAISRYILLLCVPPMNVFSCRQSRRVKRLRGIRLNETANAFRVDNWNVGTSIVANSVDCALENTFLCNFFDLNLHYYHQIDSYALASAKTNENTKLITFEWKNLWTRPKEHLMGIRDKDKVSNTKTARINLGKFRIEIKKSIRFNR